MDIRCTACATPNLKRFYGATREPRFLSHPTGGFEGITNSLLPELQPADLRPEDLVGRHHDFHTPTGDRVDVQQVYINPQRSGLPNGIAILFVGVGEIRGDPNEVQLLIQQRAKEFRENVGNFYRMAKTEPGPRVFRVGSPAKAPGPSVVVAPMPRWMHEHLWDLTGFLWKGT